MKRGLIRELSIGIAQYVFWVLLLSAVFAVVILRPGTSVAFRYMGF